MVVSPCTTFTLPEKVASFFLSRISSEAASIWIGWSRFCENPCIALGTPVHRALRAGIAGGDHRQRERGAAGACAIRLNQVLRGENIIMKIISRWRTCRTGSRLGGTHRRRFGGSQRGPVGSTVPRLSRFITTLPSNRTTSPPAGDPEPVGGQRAVQQFDVDMLFRCHRALAHVDQRLRQPRFIAAGGLQKDILMQVQHLLLGVESARRGHRA